MSNFLLKSLAELIEAGVITESTATDIQTYYQHKSDKSQSRLFVVFGVLGAILVGLGIILIIAHNWDELPKTTKTAMAFLPLAIGQILCGYVIIKRSADVVWRESTSAFLFFAVGASISLISQIYNIPGNLSSFLLTWMALCLPLVYLMRSSISSFLILIGITFYACETSYWTYPGNQSYGYWIVIILLLPHYIYLYKKKPDSNFLLFHNWLLPLSIIISLGTVADKTGELMFIAYMSLFGLLYIIGNSAALKNKPLRTNTFTLFGSLGTIILLLSLSFDWYWKELPLLEVALLNTPEFYVLTFITLLAFAMLMWQKTIQSWSSISRMEITFVLFILIFFTGYSSSITPIIMINLLVFALGILTIMKGANQNHLGILNYGLLIITALVVCRFFDTNISFVIRGLLFVGVGIGFFMTNYWMLKKRRKHEQ